MTSALGLAGKSRVRVEKWKKLWKTGGPMFAGSFECRMDPQGRVPIPPAFRRKVEDAGDVFILTYFDDAIAGYTKAAWLSLERQVLALPAFSKKARALSRVLASRAHEARVDGQGRVLVPVSLRKLAGIARDVVVIGAMDRFEIWPASKWSAFATEAESLLDAASSELSFGETPPSTTQA
jgi:MraZ protein